MKRRSGGERILRRRATSPLCLPVNPDGSESRVIDMSQFLEMRERGKNSSIATSTRPGDTIISVFEGRGALNGRIGVVVHDVRYPEIDICEFVESREYSRLKTMIHISDVCEILIPHAAEERGVTKLLGEALASAFPDVKICAIHNRHFNSSYGAKLVKSLANAEVSNVDEKSFDKHLGMAAFSTLVKYVQDTRVMHFRGNSMRIRMVQIEKCCLIDYSSWKSLELVENEDVHKAKQGVNGERRSLLAVMKHTLTANGARHLRSNVLQPSADKNLIEARLDAVDELIEQQQLTKRLRQLLMQSHELDTIMAMCIQSSNAWTVSRSDANISQVIKLGQTLQVIEEMRSIMDMARVTSTLLKNKLEFLKDGRFEQMAEVLASRILQPQTVHRKNSLAMRNMKFFSIREGISINLDVARKAYIELVAKVEEIAEELTVHLPNAPARLSYSNSRGFHYTVVCNNASNFFLPPVFIQSVRNRSSVTFSSKTLFSINVMLASDIVVFDLIEELRPLLPVLYYAMDALSTIDYLCSLATYATLRDTVRPRFGDAITIGNGRHPILDWANPNKVVTNDTCLTRDRRFGIITGPNMAGKSTYLKQVAQLCIIAQSGCPIPANFAVLPVLTLITSRMGHNDLLMRKKSAFALEMNDAASILKKAGRNSLVVLDELARSTSTEEGIAITYAISEKFVSLKCFVLLATHYLDISALDHHSMVVENFHFRSRDPDDEDFTPYVHKLLKGPYRGPMYGFELVELSTFPTSIITHATLLANSLRAENEQRDYNHEVVRRRIMVRLWHQFRELSQKSADIRHVSRLREQFVEEMRAMRDEEDDE